MRSGLLVSVVLAGFLLQEQTCFANDCSNQPEKIRAKPREIRGFKPDHISTAYGFGKREISKQSQLEKITKLLLHSPRSVAIHWLVREMDRNPEFARKVLRMVIADEDPDRSLTEKLFKAEQTMPYV